MNVLVEFRHNVDHEYNVVLFEASKIVAGRKEDGLILAAINNAIADANKQIEVDQQTEEAIFELFDTPNSCLNYDVTGKVIDDHVTVFWGG
jgi:hypothetical protein